MIDWMRVLYAAIVILLYVPVVFMGANVFFPEEDYPQDTCYSKYPYPEKVDAANTDPRRVERDACGAEYQKTLAAYEKELKRVGGQKYVFVVLFSLVALLVVLLVNLDPSIRSGLFVAVTLSVFISTWTYFESRSVVGFGILFAIFIGSLFFINRSQRKGAGK